MGILADIVIDRHILDGITIAGLLLGVLGSLYLAYEFLDRQQRVLRWLTRLLSFSLLGCLAILVVVGTASFLGWGPLITFGYGPFGVLLTVLGMVVLIMYLTGSSLSFPLPVREGKSLAVTKDHGVTVIVQRPPLFSWSDFGGGWLFSGIFGSLMGWTGFIAGGWGAGLTAGIEFGLIFALIFGFADAISWWVDLLPERQLGVIGIFLILFGFVLALAQPLADILDLPVH